MDVTGADFSQIEKRYVFLEKLEAPVNQGDVVGSIEFLLQGKMIGNVSILAMENVEKAIYIDYLQRVIMRYLL